MTKNKKQNKKQAKNQPQPKKLETIGENDSFKLTFKWSQVEPIYQKFFQQALTNFKTPGFRKGKAPAKLAEKKLDQGQLFERTLQQLLPKAYVDYVKEHKIKPLTEPEFRPIKLNKGEDWEVEVFYASKPDVKIKGYKKIVKTAKKKADETIKEMEEKRKKQADEQKKKEKADKKDDKKKKSKKKPSSELSDQQKKDVRTQTIFKHLAQELEPVIPELLIKQNTRREIQTLQNRLKQLNIEMDQYLASQGLNFDQLASRMAFNSLSQLQVEFLLDAIAQKEEIEATDQDVKEKIEKIEDKKTREKMAEDEGYQNYLKSIIVKQKVIDHLLQI